MNAGRRGMSKTGPGDPTQNGLTEHGSVIDRPEKPRSLPLSPVRPLAGRKNSAGNSTTADQQRQGRRDSHGPLTRGPVRALMSLLVVVGLSLAATNATAVAGPPSFDRHWEMASPTEKFSSPGLIARGLSPDGMTVGFGTNFGNGLPGTGSVTVTQGGMYLGLRDQHSWSYLPMNLPATPEYGDIPNFLDSTLSMREHLYLGRTDLAASAWTLFKTRVDGPPVRLGDEIMNLDGPTLGSMPAYKGATADFSHVVFAAGQSSSANPTRYLATDPPLSPNGISPAKLYESIPGTPPVLRRVDVDNAGSPIDLCRGGGIGSAGSGVSGSAERAISANGQRIFFSAAPDCDPTLDLFSGKGLRRIYARIGGTSTVEISGSECDRVADPLAVPPVTPCNPVTKEPEYQSASAAGDKVYFLSTDQLTDEDTDTTKDLYVYDFEGPSGQHLTLVSEGEGPTPGAGAKVEAVSEVSEDGLRAYFLAKGVLTTEPNEHGQSAVSGQSNLYLVELETGRTVFVASFGVGGGLLPQLADPAGRYLGILAFVPLTADDTDNSSDLYLYDAQAETLRRVSISRDGFGSNGNGELGVGWAANGALENVSWAGGTGSPLFRLMSEDGSRVIFKTDEALQVEDVNNVSDLYEWHNGQVGLVSDGIHPRGVFLQDPGKISADGSAVAFSTGRALLPERDTDTAHDVYVARLGTDVDPYVAPKVEDPCVKDACQGQASTAPPGPVVGSISFGGDGNVRSSRNRGNPSVRLSKLRAVSGSTARLKVRVPGAGRVWVKGAQVRRTSIRAAKAGRYTLKFRLKPQAAKLLIKRKRLSVGVRVSYRSKDGQSASKRATVTFKQPASKRAKARKGGR